jgi:uncharacterized protein YggE
MEGLVNEVNKIDNVVFSLQNTNSARKLAMKDAKLKAEDYVSVLKGKAVTITIHKTINHSLLCKDEDNGDG